MKVLELEDVGISAEQLLFVLSHFPALDELRLLKLRNCHSSAFYGILKSRDDKMDNIDDEESYDVLIPSEGIVFKEYAKSLTLGLQKAKAFNFDLHTKSSSATIIVESLIPKSWAYFPAVLLPSVCIRTPTCRI